MSIFKLYGMLNNGKSAMDDETIARVKQIVYDSLVLRRVKAFRIYMLEFDTQPVLLIDAVAQGTLKNSSIIEAQLLKLVRAQTKCNLAGVYWRFRHESLEQNLERSPFSGAEQAKPVQKDTSHIPVATPYKQPPPTLQHSLQQLMDKDELVDVRHLPKDAIEVSEVSFHDFRKFANEST